MKFEEKDFIDLTNIPTTFIYFLVQNQNVVYVGQTTKGLSRVYEHLSSKQFSNIYVIPCDKSDLDYLEDFYIFKYAPIYNKQPNRECRFALSKVIRKLKDKYSGINITKRKLNLILQKLDITPVKFNDIYYIKTEEYYIIENAIDECMKGVTSHEIFNIRI